MTKNGQSTAGDRLSAAERLAFIRNTVEKHNLTHQELAFHTGYSVDSVCAWLTDSESPRHRNVPARVVDRLLLELSSGRVKGSK